MYIIARNAKKRPMLQHAIDPEDLDYTLCGVWVRGWSHIHTRIAIPVLLCLKCEKIEEGR